MSTPGSTFNPRPTIPCLPDGFARISCPELTVDYPHASGLVIDSGNCAGTYIRLVMSGGFSYVEVQLHNAKRELSEVREQVDRVRDDNRDALRQRDRAQQDLTLLLARLAEVERERDEARAAVEDA